MRLDFIEEPVAPEHWHAALELSLPYALDETLLDPSLADELLQKGRISAVVLKPTVLGGLRASFEMAERAAAHGVRSLVSHTFDGPVARAATAELALATKRDQRRPWWAGSRILRDLYRGVQGGDYALAWALQIDPDRDLVAELIDLPGEHYPPWTVLAGVDRVLPQKQLSDVIDEPLVEPPDPDDS